MNRNEYNILVEKQSKNLFGFVFKYLRNSEDANDIVQDVFEKLWKNRKKIESSSAKAWMFRSGHNALINFAKKKSRTDYCGEHLPEVGRVDNTFETKQIVDKVLETLPPLQKSIVLLRDLEGYNYQEIGEILKISESKVKVYLFRARKKMQKQLKNLTVYK